MGCGHAASGALTGLGDSWPLVGLPYWGWSLLHPEGLGTLVFLPVSRAFPLRALEWGPQRPKCGLKLLLLWKVSILFFWTGTECSRCGIYGASGQVPRLSCGKPILSIMCQGFCGQLLPLWTGIADPGWSSWSLRKKCCSGSWLMVLEFVCATWNLGSHHRGLVRFFKN